MVVSLFDAAERVYTGGGWPVTAMDDRAGFAIDVEGNDGAWTALVVTDDDDLVFCFYSIAPVGVDVDDPVALARMSEFADRVNHGLVAGTFEIDRDDGEVRLRTGLELATFPSSVVDDPDVLDAIVLDLSAANIGIMDRYLAGLVAVATGTVPVADVVGEIEGAPVAG